MVELKLFIMSINKGLGLNFQSYHGGIEMYYGSDKGREVMASNRTMVELKFIYNEYK